MLGIYLAAENGAIL